MQKDHDYYRSDARMPGEAKLFSYEDRATWPWRLRFIDWLGRVLGVDKIVEALPEPVPPTDITALRNMTNVDDVSTLLEDWS